MDGTSKNAPNSLLRFNLCSREQGEHGVGGGEHVFVFGACGGRGGASKNERVRAQIQKGMSV